MVERQRVVHVNHAMLFASAETPRYRYSDAAECHCRAEEASEACRMLPEMPPAIFASCDGARHADARRPMRWRPFLRELALSRVARMPARCPPCLSVFIEERLTTTKIRRDELTYAFREERRRSCRSTRALRRVA